MAESTEFIIQYLADLHDFKTAVAQLEQINQHAAEEFALEFTNAAKIVSKQIESISAKPIINPQTGEQTLGVFRKINTVFKDTDGSLKTLAKNTVTLDGQTKILNQTITNGAKGGASFATNLANLGGRALLTIPIWLGLRTAVLGALSLFSNGAKFLIDFEAQLAQIKITGAATDEQIQALGKGMLSLSTAFGISNKDVAEGAVLFIQQGRALNEIIPLLTAVAKLSLITGDSVGKSVEDLTAIINAFEVQADETINVIDSLTAVQVKYAVTTRDLTDALKVSASAASTLGVSFDSLLGFITAIKTGTRDTGNVIGRVLRVAFSRLANSSAEAVESLTGVPLFLDAAGNATKTVTPTLRNMDAVLGELSISFNKLGTAQQAQLAKLIGGERNFNQIIALFKNYDIAVKSAADSLFGLGAADSAVSALTDTTANRIKQLSGRWNELIATVGNTGVFKGAISVVSSLVQGISEVLNPQGNLKDTTTEVINKQTDALARQVKFADAVTASLGKTKELKTITSTDPAAVKFVQTSVEATVSALNKASAQNGLGFTIDSSVKSAADLETALEKISKQTQELKLSAEFDKELNNAKLQAADLGAELSKAFGLNNSHKALVLFGQKDVDAAQKAINSLQVGHIISPEEQAQLQKVFTGILNPDQLDKFKQGFTDLSNANKLILNEDQERVRIADQLVAKVKLQSVLQKTAQQIEKELLQFDLSSTSANRDKLAVLAGQLKILNQQKGLGANADLINKLNATRQQLLTGLAGEEHDVNKLLLDDAIERLKTEGATNSEILQATQAYKNQLGIQSTVTDKISDQLAKERALTEEKKLQNKLGNDSIKLFDISNTQGVDVAKKIGDVLQGNIDFDSFVRQGGAALDTFKTQFADEFKQQQAQEFFQGNRVAGLPDLRGGQNVAIDETALQNGISPVDAQLALRQRQAQGQLQQQLQQLVVTANVNVDIKGLDFAQAKEKIIAEIIDEIQKDNSLLGISLDNRTAEQ